MKINSESSPIVPVIVVGAGAAGLMAAIFAASRGNRVLLLERTRDGGRKILISGGGRCNILPSNTGSDRFVSSASPQLFRRILRAWPLEGQRRFFEQEVGLSLALEPETGKWFPVSNNAREVRDRLLLLANNKGVEIRFDNQVTGVEPSGQGWVVHLRNREPLRGRALVVASGGLSVPATGSDGMGLAWARQLGHQVHETYPALTPLTQNPARHACLAGVSLKVRLTARVAGEKAVCSQGGFLFTHQGYSGPATLDISHLAVKSQQTRGPRLPIHVQWSCVDERGWHRQLQQGPGSVNSVIRRHLPARLVDTLLQEAGMEPNLSIAQLRRQERQRLIEVLTRYPLLWTGHEGYKKAEVTGGGVALDELDPRTLESRRQAGLYLCGEMLDAFGPIGGYNFLWAWVTGRTAGLGAAEKVAALAAQRDGL